MNDRASDQTVVPIHATSAFQQGIAPDGFPAQGMDPDAAYELLRTALMLDGRPTLNLASFVTTWMEPQAEALIHETLRKNHIDHDEYPAASLVEEACVHMLGALFNAPDPAEVVGVATIGSSEAIMLGLLAHKWSWRARREAAGADTTRPNVVFGAETHVVWDKFAKYFDVEMRKIPMRPDRWVLSADDVAQYVDENTIAVGAVLGTTHIGEADPIKEINDLLVQIKAERGWDIPLHVDGASGGFIAPFAHPDFEFDFRLEQVASINASGHKYGLVYPGVGWLIFRDQTKLPDELVFSVNYLGGAQPTYTFNFSRGSAMVQAQAYNFLRLGREGYTRDRRVDAGQRQVPERAARGHGKVRDPQPRSRRAGGDVPAQGRPWVRRLPPVRSPSGERLDCACLQPSTRCGGRAPHARGRADRPQPPDDRPVVARPAAGMGRAGQGTAAGTGRAAP